MAHLYAWAVHAKDCQQFFSRDTAPSSQDGVETVVAPRWAAASFTWKVAASAVAAGSQSLFLQE